MLPLADSPPNPNYFTQLPLTRPVDHRADKNWIDEMLVREDAMVCAFWCGAPLLHSGGAGGVCWLTPAAIKAVSGAPAPIFLGLRAEAPYFAIDFSDATPPLQEAPFSDLARFRPLREAAFDLEAEELAIIGLALWLVSWRAKTKFSPRTGAPLDVAPGGTKMIDGDQEIFPRIDPVAITLVLHEDACLLGRSPQFPPGWFSALAGYLEPGETLEECAAREIFEEAGVRIHNVRYQFTQPWPLTGALMAGFFAHTHDRTLRLDTREVVEARWVSRGEVKALLDGEPREDLYAPPVFTIAHHLLQKWVKA